MMLIVGVLGIVVLLSCILSIDALYCLSCADSVSPRHCHTVRKCKEGQVCYTESHFTENGVIVYDTGCTHVQTCQSKYRHMIALRTLHDVDPNHHSLCIECCSIDACNSHGCGQPGYPATRGPICFNCLEVSDPTLCDKIKACQMDQVCHIRKEVEFGDTYFVSSCSDNRVCSSYLNIFGKRSSSSCSRCCHGDLCNDNCSDVISSTMTTTRTTTVTISPTPSTTQKLEPTGNRGREFLVLFMRNKQGVSGSPTLYITTDNESSVRISSSPYLSNSVKSAVDTNVSFTSYLNFTLPVNLTCEIQKIEPKAVMIETSKLSTVTIFDSFHQNSNDGTLVIPTNRLSNHYIISSINPYNSPEFYDYKMCYTMSGPTTESPETPNDYSQFAIGALSDRTSIKIELKTNNCTSITLFGRTYTDGDVISITLDRFESIQISNNRDLTGTFITSSEPIAVYSGNRCNQLMPSTGCSHLLTQLPPISELDHHFIVPPFHNSYTSIHAVTPTQNTINITYEGTQSSLVLKAREYDCLIHLATETAVLISRYPVLVTVFGEGSTSPVQNPYMTIIPGMHQYVDYYKIAVPAGYTENFLCIIVPAVSIHNLQINGFSIDHYKTVYQRSVYVYEAYKVRVVQVQSTSETYVLSTTDKSKFGLIVYGGRPENGYGFAGNFVLA